MTQPRKTNTPRIRQNLLQGIKRSQQIPGTAASSEQKDLGPDVTE